MKIFRQLRFVLFVAGATVAGLLTSSLYAATPEEQAVLAPVKAMFDGMAKRDATAIKEPLLPGGTMVLMRDGKPTQMTFDAFADRVGRPGTTQIEERIHDPLVRIDNDLAMVWAPFEFLIDGKVDHWWDRFIQSRPQRRQVVDCECCGYWPERLRREVASPIHFLFLP